MKYFTLLKNAKRHLILIAVFLITLIMLFFIQKTFTIRSIEISGIDHIAGLDTFSGRLIFLLSDHEMEKTIYERNPGLDNIVVTKKYPATISISARKTTIAAVLKATDGFFYLTRAGRVVAKNRQLSSQRTLINSFEHIYLRSYSVGEVITSKDIIYSLFFVTKLADLGISVARVDILGFDVLVFKVEDKTYYITLSKTKEEQYDELKMLVNHFAIEGQQYRSIDLRFDKPIIRFIN